ncbi:hypothetical protein PKCBPO_00760 [Methylorubrum thiocyanatum]
MLEPRCRLTLKPFRYRVGLLSCSTLAAIMMQQGWFANEGQPLYRERPFDFSAPKGF